MSPSHDDMEIMEEESKAYARPSHRSASCPPKQLVECCWNQPWIDFARRQRSSDCHSNNTWCTEDRLLKAKIHRRPPQIGRVFFTRYLWLCAITSIFPHHFVHFEICQVIILLAMQVLEVANKRTRLLTGTKSNNLIVFKLTTGSWIHIDLTYLF